MTNQYRTKEFKILQQSWYKKLEGEGFNDAEKDNGLYLKEWHSCYFQLRHAPDLFQIKQQYYSSALHHLQTGSFQTELERQVWELHANGKSYREITLEIKTTHTHHSPHCSSDICDLFCPLSLSAQAPPLFNYLNKDKVNAIVTKIKHQMLKALKEQPEE